jgi:hypothetical protein
VALAGNNPNLPDDTQSRVIRVMLFPDVDGKVEESDWELIEGDAADLKEDIVTWVERVRLDVRTNRPDLPAGVKGRLREKWSPLKRVAVQASEEWGARVDAMALRDLEQQELDKEDGLVHEKPGVVLLRNIFDVWLTSESFTPSIQLVDLLVDRFPAMWGEESPYGRRLTTKRLGSMLAKSYRIHSHDTGRGTPRGYSPPAINAAGHCWHPIRRPGACARAAGSKNHDAAD